jgi:glycosyltransferase involved in cell wall biosynthesis
MTADRPHMAGETVTAPYRVSVVTAVRNDAAGLRRTLESIAAQTYPAVDSVVIDGGSSDGSVDVLQEHADHIGYWVSEPDTGIAEAMNKGLAHAGGDLVLFLHANDRFADDHALERVMACVTDMGSIWAFDILHGSAGRYSRTSPRPFKHWAWLKNPLPHQGVLCPRHVFAELGDFDTSLKIDMDYDFWLRAYRAGYRLQRVPEVLAIMDDGGVSSRRDWPGLAARFREERRVQLRHARTSPWRWLYRLYWPLYLGYRRLRQVAGL